MAGATGPAGPTGATGPAGSVGPQGPTGATGQDGPHTGGINNVYIAPAFIGGGQNNQAGSGTATVSGGDTNAATGIGATVGGGTFNLSFTHGTVGGGKTNQAIDTAATVAGGAYNTASFDYASVGGGSSNTASGGYSTVGGGLANTASSLHSSIGGGLFNEAQDSYTTVAGGLFNTASDSHAAVGGGGDNLADGYAATIPGGLDNRAAQDFTFAAGRRAKALHHGAFVWGDSLNGDKQSSALNQFNVYASGGARIFSNGAATAGVTLAPGGSAWAAVSDRNAKEHFESVDPRAVLAAVAALPITTWNYKTQDDSIRHMGPMAQDFHAAFGLGFSDELIVTVDTDGVALAAIQGLNLEVTELMAERDASIRALRSELESLRAELQAVRALLTEPATR